MAEPSDLPVVDHHCHLSPDGEGVAAAQRFRAAGGTHLFLATQQYGPKTPTRLEEYAAQFETTERIARAVEAETGLVVYLTVAPYPIDMIRAAETLGLQAAVGLQRSALELAGRWVEEGKAVALGEIGRPHFAVAPELAEASSEVLRSALEIARDVGCPAVVHCEELDAAGYRELAAFAARASFPLGKLVKHYAKTVLSPEELGGIVPSYLASRDAVAGSLRHPGPWFWETDFLDDPKRPGAVLDLATVARRAKALRASAPENLDLLRIPFEQAVEQVYGFLPTVRHGVPTR
ncbi:MAG: TatD family hydrolase [Thermoplasmata archaeon]|nr:TatD family hydrolase [Thermoplasmata archaeon]